MPESNIKEVSNVYVLRKDFQEDREFQSKVRGYKNLQNMVGILSGLSWAGVELRLEEAKKYLTPLQEKEWNLGKYCALLGDREELVTGLVMRDGELHEICRCYKTECKRFIHCYENNPVKDDLQVIIPGIHNRKPVTRNKQPIPVIIPPEQDEDDTNTDDIEITFPEEMEIPDLPSSDKLSEITRSSENAQETIITASPSEEMLVLAGPGTGKTHSLLSKLEYMVEQKRSLEADSILLLCFTRAAVGELKERFQKKIASGDYSDDLERLDIRTFDSFATRVLIARGVDIAGKDYDSRIKSAIDEIIKDPLILEEMKHFIVDEIQDLVGVRAKLVQTILENRPEGCGFTLLGDNLQGIYDYQIQETPGEISAADLLDWVKSHYKNTLKIVRLSGNHRQVERLAGFTARARRMLEEGDPENCRQFLGYVTNLRPSYKAYNFPLPADDSRTAILCRNNGESLKLSGMLRKRQIDHVLKRRHAPELTPVWIADLILSQNRLVTYDQFTEIMHSAAARITDDHAKRTFDALLNLSDSRGSRIDIQSLTRQLLEGKRLPDDFYEATGSVSVSTIHQSKGREFDAVFLLRPWNVSDLQDNYFEEAKVYYVAVTRPKKSLNMLDKGFSKSWVQKIEASERWMELGTSSGRKVIRGFEVGIEGDIDEQSFVDTKLIPSPDDNQDYIRAQVKPGDQVILKKAEDTPYYCIYHRNNLIGRMSGEFSSQLAYAVNSIRPGSKYRPAYLDEIFVDQIYSVLRRPEMVRQGIPDNYLQTCVWYGVNLVGMGRVRNDLEMGGDGDGL